MKSLLIISMLFATPFAFADSEFEVSAVEDVQSKACVIAVGAYRRDVKARCAKLKKKVDWNKLHASDCIQKKLSSNKYKATFKVTYACK